MKIRHLILAFIAVIVPLGFGWQAEELTYDDFFYAIAEVESNHNDRVWKAICQVESGGDPDAHNPSEDARGIAQIRAVMVEDVNRIVGEDRYTHNDAYDPVKAREMFDIYNRHYHPKGDYERIARCWNGGPKGHKKKATLPYWEKVKKAMK